jgi:hypothetical protein
MASIGTMQAKRVVILEVKATKALPEYDLIKFYTITEIVIGIVYRSGNVVTTYEF